MLPDTFGEFMQFVFFETLAGVGGGLVDGVDGEELKCAAVLHDVPSWGACVMVEVVERTHVCCLRSVGEQKRV